MKTSRRQSAFTLIELLVVIAIIGVLTSLVLSAAGFVQKKGARSRAEAEIAAIAAALESYKADNGDYPLNEGISNSLTLLTNLMPAVGTGGKVYYEFKSKMTNQNNGIMDPFGGYYYYRYPGDPNQGGTNFYDLWTTAGSALKTNGWIKNW